MSKIKDILAPITFTPWKTSAETESLAVRVVQGVAQLDENLDTLRAVAQTLIDDCDTILNRREGAQQTNGNIWTGMPINAARDIKQRAVVMLRLLDGEEL